MAAMTSLSVVAVILLLSPADAQTSGSGSIPGSLIDMLNKMTQPSSSSSSSSSFSSSSPQISLVESFGPIASSTLESGTQIAIDPFSSTSPQSSATSSNYHQQQQQQQSQTTGENQAFAGGHLAKFFAGGSHSGRGSVGGGGFSSNSVSGGAGPSASSEPLHNDILSKVQAFVNRASPYGPPPGNGSYPPPPISGSGMGMGPGGPSMNSNFMGGYPAHSDPGMMGVGGMGPMPDLMPPLGPMGAMMPGGPPMTPMQSQAMLRVGRRLGQKLGLNMYYEIHGCEDPTQLFSGRQKAMATMAMAQGCHSLQAMHVCRMAQVKERIGNSLLTSRVLPPHVRSRLENCLSAKVLFSPVPFSLSPSPSLPSLSPPPSLPSLSPLSPVSPTFRECGMLLSTVMDGGVLDPESMINTRRSMLPWSCNESNVGPNNNIPYRVCCPGKVMEPTVEEAQIVRRMINA